VPGDILSTIYRALGISNHAEILDQFHRPYRVVPAGDIIPALLV
jgi:hypothetical protein